MRLVLLKIYQLVGYAQCVDCLWLEHRALLSSSIYVGFNYDDFFEVWRDSYSYLNYHFHFMTYLV